MNANQLAVQLRLDEGVRLKPYKDTVGKTTIGVGRNLDDVGLSPDEVDLLLKNDILRTVSDLDKHLPWWSQLGEVRAQVLANMAFNMGIGRLLGFHDTLAAMQAGDFDKAADEMQDSLWFKQVGARATRLVRLMRLGG